MVACVAAASPAPRVYAASQIASKYAVSAWVEQYYAEWSGDCAKLLHYGYTYSAGVSYSAGNAIDQYYAYKSAGRIHGGLPRYGAPVFYNVAAPYGHTAIYVGGTTI